MDKEDNTIECICRKYRVKTSEGMIIEVESTKPMSEHAVKRLLEEDSEICSFFSNYKIVNIEQELLTQDINSCLKPEIKDVPPKGKFSPMQRFNILLKMKGEFTSKSYMGHMLDVYKVKIARYVAFDDIVMANKAGRLELVKKSGRFKIYKVLDSSSVDQKQYTSILKNIKNNKIPMNAVQ